MQKTQTAPPVDQDLNLKKRKYTGPPKGSVEAKQRMEKVRAAQWAKAGLVQEPRRE